MTGPSPDSGSLYFCFSQSNKATGFKRASASKNASTSGQKASSGSVRVR